MRSKWLSYKQKQIFYQDFSGYGFLDADLLKQELLQVQEVVLSTPEYSVLVLADFRKTRISKDTMDLLKSSSMLTKTHVRKTAVLGISGTIRILADMLIRFSGQQLTFFDIEEDAKNWLIK